mmetsp:Transcript_38349/g.108460  ORF Transcript_38349/g.108460 Transcript_38349/m.108460 type:complete len:285 (-) Transcript_38349:329-1183(-)
MLASRRAPSGVARAPAAWRMRLASSKLSRAASMSPSSARTTPMLRKRFAPAGVARVSVRSRISWAARRASSLRSNRPTCRRRSPTPSPNSARLWRGAPPAWRRCRQWPSLASAIQTCSLAATAELSLWKPGPSSIALRMFALSSGTEASAASTLTPPRAPQTSPTPPSSSASRKSSASLGGIAMATLPAPSDMAVYSSKLHQTRFRYCGSRHGAIMATTCPMLSTRSPNACWNSSKGAASPAAALSATRCWLRQRQHIHAYALVPSMPVSWQCCASVSAMSPTV